MQFDPWWYFCACAPNLPISWGYLVWIRKMPPGWYLSERSPLVMIAVCCDLLVCTYICIIANPSHITNCCVCPDLYVFALVNAHPLPCLSLDKAVHCLQTPMWLWSMPQNTQLHLWAHCRGHVWLQHSCTGPHCWTLQARHCVRLVPQRGECGSWDSVWTYPVGPCWQSTVCEA